MEDEEKKQKEREREIREVVCLLLLSFSPLSSHTFFSASPLNHLTSSLSGSIVFPDFESGVNCLKEIGIKRLQPVSIRLVDNMQFQFGQALKPGDHSWKNQVMDKIKKW